MQHDTTTPARQSVSQEDWDVVVIGAGPAGSVAATLLARQSLKVLLVEKKSFPRFKVCGGCVNNRALHLLDAAGFGSIWRSLAAPPINSVELVTPNSSAVLRLPLGRAVSRYRLDQSLVAKAIETGVQFLDATTAVVLPESDRRNGFRKVRLTVTSTPAQIVTAQIVIAADGLGRPSLHRLPHFAVQTHPQSFVGVGATGMNLPTDWLPGQIVMAIGHHGYVGMTAVEDSQFNMAAALDPSRLKTRDIPQAIAETLPASIRHRCDVSSLHWTGTRPLTVASTQAADSRLFLLGDALGYVEPFTGEGIAWALCFAVDVVPFAMQGCTAWTDDLATRWQDRCREFRNRQQRFCRIVCGLLRRPRLTGLAIQLLRWRPNLAAPIVKQITRGNIYGDSV